MPIFSYGSNSLIQIAAGFVLASAFKIWVIIIITFIYTAQIQLYSFQMRLTIKDLKIYRKKNYNIKLQHYIRKGFFKKVSLQITFKNGGASKI